MTKQIKDIISYVKNEITNGNTPKFYVYCPNAISNGTTTKQIKANTENNKKQKAIISLDNEQQNVSCESGLAALKRNKGRSCGLYGIHQFIEVNENISFINSQGEKEILHKGDKIRLFATMNNDNAGLLIRSVAGISAKEFSKKYKPHNEIKQLLEKNRKTQRQILSTLITESQNIR